MLNIQPVKCLNIKAMYKQSYSHPLLVETHKYSGLTARAASLISKGSTPLTCMLQHHVVFGYSEDFRGVTCLVGSWGDSWTENLSLPICITGCQGFCHGGTLPFPHSPYSSIQPRFKLTATSLGESVMGRR